MTFLILKWMVLSNVDLILKAQLVDIGIKHFLKVYINLVDIFINLNFSSNNALLWVVQSIIPRGIKGFKYQSLHNITFHLVQWVWKMIFIYI